MFTIGVEAFVALCRLESPFARPGPRCRSVQAGFPVFYRFDDLVAAGIVQNRTTLLRLIDNENFPPGVMIGPNTRAWPLSELEAWLAARPTARKALPPNAVHPRVRAKRRAAAEAQS